MTHVHLVLNLPVFLVLPISVFGNQNTVQGSVSHLKLRVHKVGDPRAVHSSEHGLLTIFSTQREKTTHKRAQRVPVARLTRRGKPIPSVRRSPVSQVATGQQESPTGCWRTTPLRAQRRSSPWLSRCPIGA